MKKSLVAVLSLILALSAAHAQHLTAAGATFPYPIYSKWFSEYSAAHPGVQINYQSIGSGGGIKQFCSGLVDFGASDMPMTDDLLKSCGQKLVHIPTVLGAVVPVFNVPGVTDVRFSPDVLADIYLGQITNWNDARIAKDNPGAHMPDQKIVVVHRSDASGTTFIFTDYLSKVSQAWASGGPGKGPAPGWPVGVGGKGNEGVAGLVRQIPGAIGYVELIYAMQNNITFGELRNASGNWVKGSISGVTAAAAGAKIPDDYRVSITNAPGAEAYPISSFTYLLIPVQMSDAAKAHVLHDMLSWIVKSGEGEVSALYYAPLPDALAQRVLQTVYSLK